MSGATAGPGSSVPLGTCQSGRPARSTSYRVVGEPGPRDLTIDHRAARWMAGVVTVAAIGAVVARHGHQPALAVGLALVVGCYGVLASVDLAEQRLPNRITVPLAGATASVRGTTTVKGPGQKAAANRSSASIEVDWAIVACPRGDGEPSRGPSTS